MIEFLPKQYDKEFSLDEIQAQTKFWLEHPEVVDMMSRMHEFMAEAIMNPDPVSA